MDDTRKGTHKNEHRSKAILEAAGYAVCRAAASLGVWDLVGISATDVVLCRVMAGEWPGTAEMETLREFVAPPNARKLVHRWRCETMRLTTDLAIDEHQRMTDFVKAAPLRAAVCVAAVFATSVQHPAHAGINVWTTNGPHDAGILALAIDPSTPTTLYAGTSGTGVYKSTDGAGSWQAVNAGLTNDVVRALAIDPNTRSTLYAGTQTKGVFKSTNGAGSWQQFSAGLTFAAVNALAIDPVTPTTLYAGTADGAFKSTDGASGWHAAGLGSGFVNAIAIAPSTPSTLYAGGGGQSVFKSTDGAGSWQPVNAGLPNSLVVLLAIDPTTPNTLYIGTGPYGVFKSTDGAASWQATALTNPVPGGDVRGSIGALAIDPSRPSTLYAATVGGVLKSTDGAASSQAINAGLSNEIVDRVAIDPSMPSTLHAGTHRGDVFSIEQVPTCVGDCDGSGSVTVDELITMVNIALGDFPPSACPDGGLPIGGDVNVAVIIRGVNNALDGCP